MVVVCKLVPRMIVKVALVEEVALLAFVPGKGDDRGVGGGGCDGKVTKKVVFMEKVVHMLV